MKKSLISLLALLSCCSLFAACSFGKDNAGDSTPGSSVPSSSVPGESNEPETSEPGESTEPENPHAEAMQLASEYVYGTLVEKDLEVKADYTLIGSYYSFFLEEELTITWAVDVTEGVTVTLTDSGEWLVDVDEFLTEDLLYTLTATLTDSDGHTASFTLDRKVLKAAQVVPEKIKAPVEGEAYKLYMYQEQKKNDLYFIGKMSDFYLATNNASKGEGYEVSVDVFVEKVADKDAYYLTFTNAEGVKKYIGLTNTYNNGSFHVNAIIENTVDLTLAPGDVVRTFEFTWDTNLKTLVATLEGVKSGENQATTETKTETYFLGTYNSYYTFGATPVDKAATSYVGYLVKMVNKAEVEAEDKVATEKDTLNVTTAYSGAVEATLPTMPTTYGDVVITWALKSGDATLENNVLTVASPASELTIVLTATFTCGDAVVTKDVEITVYPKSPVTLVSDPVEGTAYAFYLYQANKAKNYYFTGAMDGNFFATTDDATKAADVYVEKSGNGVKIYVMNGTEKSYITLTEYKKDTNYKASVSLTETGSVFTYNSQFSMWTCNTGNDTFYLGTYNEYTTMSASAASFVKVDNVGVSQFCANFGIIDESALPPSGGDEGGETPNPGEGEEPTTPPVVGDVPVVGKPYIFGMTQANVENKVFYLAGGMDGYYMATTTDASAAIATYIEATTGGYYFYTLNADGSKLYINMVVSGTHVNGAYEATASTVYTIDETHTTLIAIVNDAEYWFGTRNDKNYTTMGPCAVSYAGFYGVFYAVEEGGDQGGETPNPGEGEEPTTPPVVGDAPVVGKPYIFGMTQANVENKVFYLAGGMDGYYMATTTDASAAIATYIEETTGGYYFYTLNADGSKLYINMVVSGTHVNGAYEATASTVYTIDETHTTLIAIVNDAEYWFGTRNDKNYTTMGPCAVSYAGFYGVFYAVEEGGDQGGETPAPNPGEGEEPSDKPAVGDAPVVGKPYIFGMTQANVENKVFYLAGGMDGYYMATTTDASAAIATYIEETTGGYYFYTLNADGSKLYINMVVSGTHVNGAYEATASTVYTIDATHNTLIAVVNDTEYWFATRNDKTFTTMGPCAVSYEGFYGVFYAVEEGGDQGGEVTPPACEHNYVDGTCTECGEEDPNYVAPEAPVVNGGSADFDTITITSNSGGDSGYTKTYTTTNGWTTENCAIQVGGAKDSNPAFTVVGSDNTSKAPCLNGKVSAPGKVTSPTLTGGISKLTINYTKMFTDTKLGATITITDLTTGTVYTNTLSAELDKNDKFTVYTFEWVLDTAIAGDFKIEIVNNCPSQNTGNKDRLTILDLTWEAPAANDEVVDPGVES